MAASGANDGPKIDSSGIAAIVVGVAVLLSFLFALTYWLRCRKRQRQLDALLQPDLGNVGDITGHPRTGENDTGRRDRPVLHQSVIAPLPAPERNEGPFTGGIR